MNGKEIASLATRSPNFVFEIINRKTENVVFSKRKIEPMMAGCQRVEFVVGFKDTRGNEYELKVIGEKGKESSNESQSSDADKANSPDSPDSRDRDFDRDE